MKKILHINSYFIGNKLYKFLYESLSFKYKQIVYVPIRSAKLIGINFSNAENINIIYDNFLKKFHKFFFGTKIFTQYKRIDNFVSDVSDIDLIHAHTLFSDGGTAYLLSRKYNIPYILSVRNADLNYFYKYAFHYRFFSHKILINAKLIIFPSYAYKGRLAEVLPARVLEKVSDKFIVLPNGVDEVYFQKTMVKRDFSLNTITIVTACSLDKNKNVKMLIDLVAALKDDGVNVFLKIAGVGELRDYLESYSRKVNTSDSIEFLGFLNSSDLVKIFDQSHIFAMPSFYETFGISYVEAMARGLPVIYSKDQGIDGFFPDGKVGFAVNPRDVNDIKSAFYKIVENYSEISNCSADLARDFTWKKISLLYSKKVSSLFR